MTVRNRILGQAAPGAVLTDLYVVPNGGQAQCNLVITNRSASPCTFRVALAPAGIAVTNAQYVAYDQTLPANQSTSINSLFLGPQDRVRVYASATDVSFVLMGTETT